MRRSQPSAQYAAAIAFILLAVLMLAAFLVASSAVLRRISEENRHSRQFLIDWLGYKADCLSSALASDPTRESRLSAELASCVTEFGLIGDNPTIDAMRKIEKTRNVYPEILASWADLRRDMALLVVGGNRRVGPAEGLSGLLARADGFESVVRGRIELIGSFEDNQRRAIALLQQTLVVTILALAGVGFWISRDARRALEDSRRMQELIGATYSAQETERRRIALDLHDSIAQEIAASLIMARRLGEDGEGSRAALVASLKSTIDAVRRISWEMRPPELGRLGFRGALIGFIDEYAARQGLALEMADAFWNASDLGDEAAIHAYRVVQEVFANIAKHAGASRVRVRIERRDGKLSIAVEDDGSGFDAKSMDARGGRAGQLGIAGMRERARIIGGTLDIDSCPGQGTRVRLEVPIAYIG